jgi:site-specific DNA-methyltransferase (adenine-specific)
MKTDTLDLRLMDCMDLMREFPDKHFHLAVVDPPYGIGVDGKNLIANPSDAANKTILARDHKWDDAPPPPEYFHELRRVAKEQIVWGGNYFLDYLGYCKAPIIWDKLNGGSMYADGEMAWTSSGLPKNLKIWRHQWCGAFKDSERGNLRQHPTQKPRALYDWIFANYAKPGMRILDTHLGSMSSAIAAHYSGMHLTGCELDPDYYAAGIARVKRETQQTELFEPAEIHATQTTFPPIE